VVEDCVNAVGVDVNTASAPLLTRVSGLNATLAEHRRAPRRQHGAFRNRKALLNVPRLGDKTFEQAPASCASERRQPARRLGGAPGSLPGGRAHPRRHQEGRREN
jgi:hypothetical protein